jgi:hypothetical protein
LTATLGCSWADPIADPIAGPIIAVFVVIAVKEGRAA